MKSYLDLLSEVLYTGQEAPDRTGVGTLSLFSKHLPPIPVGGIFPVLTTKQIFFRGVVAELLWFLSGSTNIRPLQRQNVTFWDEWADEEGNLGAVYGEQLAHLNHFIMEPDPDKRLELQGKGFSSLYSSSLQGDNSNAGPMMVKVINQMQYMIDLLKTDPWSRRIVATTWRAGDAVERSRLSPCHGTTIQFGVRYATLQEILDSFDFDHGILDESKSYGTKYNCFQDSFYIDGSEGLDRYANAVLETKPLALDMSMTQRSADVFLGLPFNIASYSLLLRMVAQVTGLIPGNFHWHGNCVHLYINHIEQAKEQLTRTPVTGPILRLNQDIKDIFQFSTSDIQIEGYYPKPAIPASVAV